MEFSMNLDTRDINFAKTVSAEYGENDKVKAYISFLGTCAFKNYLKDCDIKVDENSLMRIKKIYEGTDISDVIANGICIDVRTYTSSDALYVPQKHFENDVLPKYYVFAIYDEQNSQIIFKGYIASKNVDKTSKTDKYFVINSTNLLPMENLIQELYNTTQTEQNINADELSGLYAAFLDGQLEKNQELQIIKLLYSCSAGREDFIEFVQFEFLTKNISNYPDLFENSDSEPAEGYMPTEDNEEQLFEEEDGFDFSDAEEDSLEDFDNDSDETEELIDIEELSEDNKQENDESDFAQTLAQTGLAGAAFAAGAAAGATAANAINTTEDSLLDLASDVADAAENIYDNVSDTVDENINSEETFDISDDLDENISEDTDELTEFSDNTDELFSDFDEESDTELLDLNDETENETEILNTDDDANNEDSETLDYTNDFEKPQLTEQEEEPLFDIEEANTADDTLAEEVTEIEDIKTEDDFINFDSEDENNTSDDNTIFEENASAEFQDNTNDEIFENDMEEISDIDFQEPEITEEEQYEQAETPAEPEIHEDDEINKQNEYDYSDLNSLLDEIQTSQTPEPSEETENIINENSQEDINIQTLFEETPTSQEEENLLNEDEYAKYVQEPSAKPVKNIAVPVIGIVTAAILAGGGIYSFHKISNKFSLNTQNPVSEIQMKSVDDFDDETFLEKTEAELLAKENEGDAANNIEPNPDAIKASDLNQSISNIFDETIYPVMVSKIAWEIPDFYTTSKYFKKYLQIAGVQLQRDLQNSLASVNGVSETGKIKLSFDVYENSSIKNMKILETSGSKEIDTIVEKSVINTLSYIKVPVIPSSENFVTLTLVINF